MCAQVCTILATLLQKTMTSSWRQRVISSNCLISQMAITAITFFPFTIRSSPPSSALMHWPMICAPASPNPTCKRLPIFMIVLSSVVVASPESSLAASSSLLDTVSPPTSSNFHMDSSASFFTMFTIFSTGAMTRFWVSREINMAPAPNMNTINVVVSMDIMASTSVCSRIRNRADTVRWSQGPWSVQTAGVIEISKNSDSRQGQSGSSPAADPEHTGCGFQQQ
mmetsp:Transcript_78402/g.209492  ORF Transcript_78402/g.209492 Transcript_78402/m.209492 type:complete len:224 (+) Transcript_78402:955-1626(+)